ncbi:MAG: GTPase ObgE [Mycoplasmatales bacterium]
MFIDQVVVTLKGGDGGDGITAFRREKYVPLGGPSGGSGGNGGNIILKVDEGLNTLLDFSYNKKYEADTGERGKNKSQHGKNAEDLILSVPPGTSVYDDKNNKFICDLTTHNQEHIVCSGGRGGRGNAELASAGRSGLEVRENGEPGQELSVRLELKLISEVGLVGMPSVGKSTIISVISKAKPKIGAYHFTTKVPKLCVVKPKNKKSFVAADLPGLIEGASEGKGLGLQFLRHIQRTKVLLHIIDMGAFEGRDPIEDYKLINKELDSYSYDLEHKKQLIVANKMDLPQAKENLEKFKKEFKDIEVVEISALTKSGLEMLTQKTADLLETIVDEVEIVDDVKVYRLSKEEDFEVKRLSDTDYELVGDEITRLFKMSNFDTYDNQRRFAFILNKMGVEEKLRLAGAKSGDIVHIEDFEFEFLD